MRRTAAFVFFCSLAASAAAGTLLLSGCKGSTIAGLPSPTIAPTFKPGVVTEYPVPNANATPFGIAEGPDGNMWVTEVNGNSVARVTPSGSFSGIPLPTANSEPEDIIAGPGGNPNVWFVETGSSKIGAINTGTLTLSEFTTPTGNAQPAGLAAAPNGVMWFGEFNNAAIASITTGGFIHEYATGIGGSAPDSVAVTNDGTVWFLDAGTNAVGKLTAGPIISEYAIPSPASGPNFIIVGPDGNLWFTESNTGNVARVNLAANPPTITEFSMPSESVIATIPFGLTWSPVDGDLWIAEQNAGQVARVTTNGVVTEYGIPGSGTTATGMTIGPDTNGGGPSDVWFTDSDIPSGLPPIGSNQVGKINIGLQPALVALRVTKMKAKTAHMRLIGVHRPGLRP